ncbi:MAG: WD40 repeat domain-containing protein [Candidatus Obscuribacterales bacterium]|nr:WD40 repeat domain-containing protein [Candidatus Obscuribacterales bacterium]
MRIIQEFFGPETNVLSFSPKGDAFSELRHGGECVAYSIAGQEQLFSVKADRGFFSYVATRVYSPDRCEILFGNMTGNVISRASASGRGKDLKLFMAADVLTVLRMSHDGRNIAAGNADGQFELWNMDQAEPTRLYNFQFRTPVPIVDISFSRSNQVVLIALVTGAVYMLDLVRSGMSTLTGDQPGQVYSIDTQRSANGIIFGGSDGTLWTLNVKGSGRIEPDDVIPFAIRRGRSLTGVRTGRVAALPDATVGLIQSTVGDDVAKVRFLSDDLVCVAGDQATEVWSLASGVPLMIARKAHAETWTPLSVGGTIDFVRVALGRRF